MRNLKWDCRSFLKQYTGEILFFCAWLIFLYDRYAKILYRHKVPHQGTLRKLIYLLLILKIVADLLRDRGFHWRDGVAVCVTVLGYFVSNISGVGPWGLFIPVALVVSARNINLRHVYLVTLAVSMAFLAYTLVSIKIGRMEDVVMVTQGGKRIRHYLGFYSNYIASYLIEFGTVYYFALRRRPTWAEALVLLAANGAVYHFTQSRCPFYTAVLLCVVGYFFCRSKKPMAECQLYRWVVPYLSLLFNALALVMIALYSPDNALLSKVNKLLTQRLRLGNEALQVVKPTFFGQLIEWHTGEDIWGTAEYFYVDCSYLKYLLMYGIVFMVLLHIGFILASRRLVQENDRSMLVGVVVLLVISVSDSMLTSLYVQPVIMIVAMAFDPATELSLLPVKRSESCR